MTDWTSRPVLVTGGASFIGSHLVEHLVARGADVRVADDFSSGSRENLRDVADEVTVFEGDLKATSFADRVMDGVESVFHLAADHGGRGYIAENPADCATNLALDTIVYEAAVNNDVEHVTFASSACTYPTHLQREKQRLHEDMVSFDEPGKAYADEVYGWAKLMGERSLLAFREQHGIEASIVRIFTAYGPRENETHAVMALIAKAYAGQDPYQIWGDGRQTRNFTHVEDIVRALRLAAENVSDATPVNAGVGRYYSIREAARLVFDSMNWEPSEIEYLTSKPVGVRHRAADTTRAKELLGWEPEYSLEEGLEETVEWYIQEKDRQQVRENLEQLLHER